MNTSTRRPVYLSLRRFHFPVTAVLSIGHRITGVLLFLALGPLLWLFEHSINGPAGYLSAVEAFRGWFGGLILLVLIAGAILHLLAGIRYLLIDLDVGVDYPTARRSALAVFGVAAALLLLIVVVA